MRLWLRQAADIDVPPDLAGGPLGRNLTRSTGSNSAQTRAISNDRDWQTLATFVHVSDPIGPMRGDLSCPEMYGVQSSQRHHDSLTGTLGQKSALAGLSGIAQRRSRPPTRRRGLML